MYTGSEANAVTSWSTTEPQYCAPCGWLQEAERFIIFDLPLDLSLVKTLGADGYSVRLLSEDLGVAVTACIKEMVQMGEIFHSGLSFEGITCV